jgi:hypothetical protein
MDFRIGGWTMSHALGRRKPWHGRFVRQALDGYPPSKAVRAFCENLNGPIPVFAPARARRLQRSLKVAALISRFYHRSQL